MRKQRIYLNEECLKTWDDFHKLALHFRCLRHSQRDIKAMKNRLGEVCFISSEVVGEIGSKVLCSFFMKDYPFFSAAATKNKIVFFNQCRCLRKKRKRNKKDDELKMERFWALFPSTMLHALKAVRTALEWNQSTKMVFRGISFKSKALLYKFCTELNENSTLNEVQS